MFADTPHLLKLIRRHTLNGGLELPDGSVLDAGLFNEVWRLDNSAGKSDTSGGAQDETGFSARTANEAAVLASDGQLKLCPRLTRTHIDVSLSRFYHLSMGNNVYRKFVHLPYVGLSLEYYIQFSLSDCVKETQLFFVTEVPLGWM